LLPQRLQHGTADSMRQQVSVASLSLLLLLLLLWLH
jgi:hypothetical protein